MTLPAKPEPQFSAEVHHQLAEELRRKWESHELPDGVYQLPQRGRRLVETVIKIARNIGEPFLNTEADKFFSPGEQLLQGLSIMELRHFEALLDVGFAVLDEPEGAA